MEHPRKEVLLRFLLGEANRPESQQVVRHLLACCPVCAVTLQEIHQEPPLGPPPSPEAYDPALARAAALLRLWTRRTHEEDPAAAADHPPNTVASGKAARRRWLFG